MTAPGFTRFRSAEIKLLLTIHCFAHDMIDLPNVTLVIETEEWHYEHVCEIFWEGNVS